MKITATELMKKLKFIEEELNDIQYATFKFDKR